MKDEDYTEIMSAVAAIRPQVDAFFDKVIVNADQPELRKNRLFLLAWIRSTLEKIADFTVLEGQSSGDKKAA